MYDELVKRMRKCATEAGACKTCELYSNPSCTDVLMEQAADAIEELVGFVQEAERDRDEYRERLDKANDAIEELSKLADAIPHVCECCVGCELEKKNGGCNHAFILSPKRAKEYLSKPRWIPVTERLPEKNGSYLVYVYGEVTEMNFWHGTWHRLGDDYTKAVSHWMPLPEPPKEET